MANNFVVGDIVKLKSGGPEMTVKTQREGHCTCQWFAGKKLESGVFPEGTLEKVEKAE